MNSKFKSFKILFSFPFPFTVLRNVELQMKEKRTKKNCNFTQFEKLQPHIFYQINDFI